MDFSRSNKLRGERLTKREVRNLKRRFDVMMERMQPQQDVEEAEAAESSEQQEDEDEAGGLDGGGSRRR